MRQLLSKLYSFFIRHRNERFDAQIGVKRVDVPVISVGNLSVGGSGKTPLVHAVITLLLADGRKPAIISRGYGRRSRGLVVVSDGQSILCDVEQSGDELMMLARRLKNVPIIASELRYLGASKAVREYHVDCIVLDDGFQHRQFHRDCDIVILDPATIEHPRVVPAGLLREPLSGLRRADIVCHYNSISVTVLDELLSENRHAVRAEIAIEFDGCQSLDTSEAVDIPSKALAVCAIAEPQRFTQSLSMNGCVCVGTRYFRDHHFYSTNEVHEMVKQAGDLGVHHIITTEKDASKLRSFQSTFEDAGINVVVLCIQTRVCDEELMKQRLGDLFKDKTNKDNFRAN